MTEPATREPVRVGLVGLGNHGRTIQRAVEAAPNLHVVAVHDPLATEVEAALDRFGCEAAPSYDALLARDDLEAVVLVTPNHLHRPQVEAALAHGRDVFVEKPIANTVADGQAMVEAAEAAGRLILVGHNMRRNRPARTARRLMDEERLGKVASIEVHFSSDTVLRLDASAWRLRPEQCPMLPMMQLGIHAVDLVHYLLGPVEEVFAYTRGVTTPPGVVDQVSSAFRVEGGTTGTFVSNYCTPVAFEYRIAGTEGWVHCTPSRLVLRARSGEEDVRDFSGYDLESYTLQMAALGEAVRTRVPPETDGRAGLAALAVVEAMERSAAAGHPIAVSDVLTQPTPEQTSK